MNPGLLRDFILLSSDKIEYFYDERISTTHLYSFRATFSGYSRNFVKAPIPSENIMH